MTIECCHHHIITTNLPCHYHTHSANLLIDLRYHTTLFFRALLSYHESELHVFRVYIKHLVPDRLAGTVDVGWITVAQVLLFQSPNHVDGHRVVDATALESTPPRHHVSPRVCVVWD